MWPVFDDDRIIHGRMNKFCYLLSSLPIGCSSMLSYDVSFIFYFPNDVEIIPINKSN